MALLMDTPKGKGAKLCPGCNRSYYDQCPRCDKQTFLSIEKDTVVETPQTENIMIAAYEIGYYSGDVWVSSQIISASSAARYPDKVAERFAYYQRWEMTDAEARNRNVVGYIERPHLPGTTIVRELIANQVCSKCSGSGEKEHVMGPVNCICGGTGYRLQELEGRLREYHDRGF